jgi:hypothetical protein
MLSFIWLLGAVVTHVRLSMKNDYTFFSTFEEDTPARLAQWSLSVIFWPIVLLIFFVTLLWKKFDEELKNEE